MRAKLASWILRTLGWEITGNYPIDYPKNILVVAPHTSWIDFPLGVLVRTARKMDTYFLGKKSLFVFPLGAFFRWMGGYPVDRSGHANMVDAVVDVFDQHKSFDVAIAPEGTRRKVDRFRTGFYWIAKKSGAAIIPVQLDYQAKKVNFLAPIFPSEHSEADISKIEELFRGVVGKVKEHSFT